ncbi:hypothetical protein CSKR_108480, partial [Clonorchis sinensis]
VRHTPNRCQCRLFPATLTTAFYRGEEVLLLKLRFRHGNVSDAGSNGKWMCWQTQALQNACDLMKCGNGFKTILVLRRRSRTITIKAFTAVLNISKCSLYSDVSFYKPSNIPDCEYPQQHQPELSSALELSH